MGAYYPTTTTGKKRSAPAAPALSKKRKLRVSSNLTKSIPPRNGTTQSKKGKGRASDRGYIEVPGNHDDADTEDSDLSEKDAGLLEEFGDSVGFLNTLDRNGISTSKKETERLRQLNKPVRKQIADDLPSVDSHDEDDESWSSGIDEDMSTVSRTSINAGDQDSFMDDDSDSEAEMPYETVPRKIQGSFEGEGKRQIHGLPIKSADGRIHATGKMIAAPPSSDEESDSDFDDSSREQEVPAEWHKIEDVSTGARFGRPAVADLVGQKSRKARIQGAKCQIGSICQEIIADPENNLGLLRRLHTFSLAKIVTPSHDEPILNDAIIRKLAMLSQLIVFKDIIPGYRIRALTDKEKAEKVSQMVSCTREWEQGFVIAYQNYLRLLEVELKAKSELAEVALTCICSLATEVTHFNFRTNLMKCIVARLSKRSWDEASDLCMNALISIFRADRTGVPSLEAVQLLNRMIKERHFNVHPEVLTCLLHLRLKTELNVRASDSNVDKERNAQSKGKAAARRAKGKPTEQPHLSKKAKKAMKEVKEIEREMRDAEAEVDKEERATTHTETLKLLFVLYFRILKHPRRTALLPAALRGISKFAHLINIDFFKDLMQVLKDLILCEAPGKNTTDDPERFGEDATTDIQHRLLCIVTAFELLSGQGEALNIDLTDFINQLYTIILPVSLLVQVDDPPRRIFASKFGTTKPASIADMLFQALTIVFSPHTSEKTAIHWRSAAFAKRLLIASLHWPASCALRALEFVESLVAKDSKLEALLSTEDRQVDGVYLPEIDDPQLCHPFGTSFWELSLLRYHHYDSRVREAAQSLSNYTRS